MTAVSVDPGAAFVGALLLSPASRVVSLCAPVAAEDIADPRLRAVFEVCVELAGEGICPDPVAVHGRAVRDAVVTGDRLRMFDVVLVDLYAGCPSPAAAEHYREVLLEEALRRRYTQMATRLAQAAERVERDDLAEMLLSEVRAWCSVSARLREVGG